MTAIAREWVIASDNRGKLNEMRRLLADAGVLIRAQGEFGISAAAEIGLTFVENALAKARHAAAHCGMPAIADDSGLCVDALDGAPGLHSSRFAGVGADDAANIDKLLRDLTLVPPAERSAYFYCALVAVRYPGDPAPLIATAHWYGHIALAPSGKHGFGYDPVFIPDGGRLTAGQLTPSRKNRLSHRARALRKLRKLLFPAHLRQA